jgi:hypothetical protein
VFQQQFVRVALATATLRGHAELALQITHTTRTRFHTLADFAVGDAVTHTDIHVCALLVMIMIINERIGFGKRNDNHSQAQAKEIFYLID